jgi:hypothetical protein
VSSISRNLNSRKNGITNATGGNILFDKIHNAMPLFHRLNSNLARLYAAKDPITMHRSELEVAMIKLFVVTLNNIDSLLRRPCQVSNVG